MLTSLPRKIFFADASSWEEVLVSLQAVGFYKDRKKALPVLQDEIKWLIAFKESLNSLEQVDVLLSEKEKVARKSGLGKAKKSKNVVSGEKNHGGRPARTIASSFLFSRDQE